MKYSNLSLTIIERPSDKFHGGYKYLISGYAGMGYVAFKTEKGFNQWLERSNVKLEHIEDKHYSDYGLLQLFRVIGTIEEKLFWSLSEIPVNAVKYKDFSNGSLVDCYCLKTETGSIVYRPNSNAKEVYKPLPLDEQIAYSRINR